MNTVLEARNKTHSDFGTPKRAKIIMSSCNHCVRRFTAMRFITTLLSEEWHITDTENPTIIACAWAAQFGINRRITERRLGHVTASVGFIFRHIFPITLSDVGHKYCFSEIIILTPPKLL